MACGCAAPKRPLVQGTSKLAQPACGRVSRSSVCWRPSKQRPAAWQDARSARKGLRSYQDRVLTVQSKMQWVGQKRQ